MRHYSRVFVVVATLWCGSSPATAADLRNILADYKDVEVDRRSLQGRYLRIGMQARW